MHTPADTDALRLVLQGNLLEDDGKLQDAMRCYEEAIRIAPSLSRAHLNRGNVLLAIGEVSAAAEAYRTALLSDPSYASGHYNLGNALVRGGQREAALHSYNNAIALKPDFADAVAASGCVLLDLGRFDDAIATFVRAVTLNPRVSEVHEQQARALMAAGHPAEAATAYARALELKPDAAALHNSLGTALHAIPLPTKALESFERAIAISPDYAEAHHNLGNVLLTLSRFERAVECYQRALAINPSVAATHFNLGNALRGMKLFDLAIVSYRHAISLHPALAEAHMNLGNVLIECYRFDEAVTNLRHALEIKPDCGIAHCNLGTALHNLGQPEQAVVSYRRALAFDPKLPEAHYGLGASLRDVGELERGVESLRAALKLNPNYVEAHHNLGNALEQLGDLNGAMACYEHALQIDPNFEKSYTNLLFALNYTAMFPPSYCVEKAREYGRQMVTSRVSRRFTTWLCQQNPQRLRVGMVSGDFRNHPVGFFLEDVLNHIDPSRVEMIAYPTVAKSDAQTALLRGKVGLWRPLIGYGDEEAAELIHGDGVHILLELSGHTANNRLPMLGWKPAPVQCSWLGYSATTGVAEIDYLLGDPYVTPPDEAHHFTERIWRLPERYICMTPPRESGPICPLPAVAAHRVTFGCFNNLAKMNDDVVCTWAKILHRVTGSQLFLKAGQLKDPLVRSATLQRFAVHGIKAHRLILEGPSSRAAYLTSYNRVDIALDPFPYPGGTTSVEGLWMGVPFLTRRGDRFLSHAGESICHNAGLADWIADDEAAYVNKAAVFAGDIDRLASLRARLRRQVLESPVFDARRFARNFENALWGMWQSADVNGAAQAPSRAATSSMD